MDDRNEVKHDELSGLEVAIIGMAGRFPGADNIDEYWENIKNGVESIAFFSIEEITQEHGPQEIYHSPTFIRAKGVINNVEFFDAHFFGYSPIEAEIMDPQLRVFYECTWNALENAGYSSFTYPDRIGIFAGSSNNRAWESKIVFSGKEQKLGTFSSGLLVDRDYLATRMAYRLNLTGPAITMRTACSTALVAITQACLNLLTGQCEIALAGAVAFPGNKKYGYQYMEGLINSHDGHVRAFDAASKGVVFSNGTGCVVLKPLENALTDGDNILAVIKGTGINNDGDRKGGFGAPSVEGQADAIRQALDMARIDPTTISYVEAHGTGTELGDPVEIEGLKLAYNTPKRQYCAIGSVKTNIGHTDTVAGVAAMIKVIKMLQDQLIPPSLHFETPNPKIDFENSPFFVNTQLTEWKRQDSPLRAAISSFGVGGTNAHIILEEAPKRQVSATNKQHHLILLSAKTEKALDQMTENFLHHMVKNPSINLADTAYTLQVGRSPFQHRQMMMVDSIQEAISFLSPLDNTSSFNLEKIQRFFSTGEKRPVFMFSGQGSQYVNMGLELYKDDPDFTTEMNRCFDIFQTVEGYDLKDILYPGLNNQATTGTDPEKINQTEITQPVIFIFEYALARVLMKWGVFPHAMIGHSIGEYTAACLSGVFSLEDAIRLVIKRGKLMQRMTKGSMLSVPLAESALRPMLKDGLELAAVNGPTLSVVSGSEEHIQQFSLQLKEKGLQVRVLHTSHAFHSKSMEPMLVEFEAAVASVTRHKPTIPYISNLSGTWITEEQAVNPGYWAKHLRYTVRFNDGLTTLLKEENALLIEVGPGRALTTFAKSHPDKTAEQMGVNLVRHPDESISDSLFFLDKIGRLWLYGQTIDWTAYYKAETRYRIPLPSYPFQKNSYWMNAVDVHAKTGGGMLNNKASNVKLPFEDWFYIPSWNRTTIPEPAPFSQNSGETNPWLFFMDTRGVGESLATQLRAEGQEVTMVFAGQTFARLKDGGYTINPGQTDDYFNLLESLLEENITPQRVVHLWNISDTDTFLSDISQERVESYLNIGFYSLIYLAQALNKQSSTQEIQLTVFTHSAFEVIGGEIQSPQQTVLLGPIKTIPIEFPNINCCAVDILLPHDGIDASNEQKLMQRLLREIKNQDMKRGSVIAYRNNYRLEQRYKPAPMGSGVNPPFRLKEKGVYLITGGLGGIGLVLAQYLAENFNARLILTGRSPLPARESWKEWLSAHPVDDPTSEKIRKMKELEFLGAKVLFCSADVTSHTEMAEALSYAQKELGPINGVIHSAGLPGAGIIQLKTREIADRVLLPKVWGTMILDRILKDIPIDFILLCSSISSVLPSAGQVDYFAANSFMDAYAYYKTSRDGIFTVSVNWDAWQEVGMAVESAKDPKKTAAELQPRPLQYPHPLFEQYIPKTKDSHKLFTHLSVAKNWPLSDHMTHDGKGLLPGVTYLEMARAAYENYAGSGPVEIFDVNFMVPMMMENDEVREAHLLLEKKPGQDYCQFTVESTLPTEMQFLQRHVLGKIKSIKPKDANPPVINIEEIIAACTDHREGLHATNEKKVPSTQPEKQSGLLIFGPHWHVIKWGKYGKKEGIIEMQLPDQFIGELEHYKLYPSLLDFATSFLFGHIYAGSAYIPFAYKRLRLYRAFPQTVYSHAQLIDTPNSSKEFLKFNVTIIDKQGNVCADIQEFTMLEVSENVKHRIKTIGKTTTATAQTTSSAASSDTELNDMQKKLLMRGIRPAEGVDAYKTILNGELPQVVVSTTNLVQRLEMLENAKANSKEKPESESSTSAIKQSRPGMSTPFVAPQTKIEEQVANIWQEFLGIEGLGTHDDFFELGGDSLKALSLLPRIHKGLNVEIPLAEFFSRSTVKKLSEFIQGANKQAYVSIEPTEDKEYYPLSPVQKGLFIQQQVSPNSTAYNEFILLPFGNDLPLLHLENNLKTIIQRHESFRTSFSIIDGEPVQRIHDQVEFAIQQIEPTPEEVGNSVQQYISSQIQDFVRPFDLSHAPLLRVRSLKNNSQTYLLLIDMHHIAADGNSVLLLIKELLALNSAQELPPLPIQYRDFSEWKRNSFNQKQDVMNHQKEYWLNEFKDTVPVLELPTDYPRPAIQSFEGRHISFEINPTRFNKIKDITTQMDITLFVTMLGMYSVFLSKLSGQEDIVIGSPTLGRNHGDVQLLIGMFVNTMALRSFPTPSKTFTQLLQELKDTTFKALENQDYPFNELVEQLNIPRNTSRSPLFDVSFATLNTETNLQNPIPRAQGEIDPKLKTYYTEDQMVKFDLSLEVTEDNNSLYFTFLYSSKLFKKETLERFVLYFNEITDLVCDNPHIPLKDIVISHGLLELDAKVPEVNFQF